MHTPILLLAGTLTLSATAAQPRETAPELPACTEDGATTTVDGTTYTCGLCDISEGRQLSVWAPGKHDVASMEAVCLSTARSLANIAPQSMRIKVVAPPERKY